LVSLHYLILFISKDNIFFMNSFKCRTLFFFVIFLLSNKLFSQSSFEAFKQKIKTHIDRFEYQQALSQIKAHKVDANQPTHAYQLMLLEADILLAEGDYKKAKMLYEEVEKKAVVKDDSYLISYANTGIGDLSKYSGAYESALLYYHHAYNVMGEKKVPELSARIYLGLADVYKNSSKYQEAIENYTKALEVYENTDGKISKGALNARLGLGNVYVFIEDYMKALKEYNEILNITFEMNGENHENTSSAYNNLGVIYFFEGHYDVSLRYFNQSLEIDKTIHGEKHPNIANDYFNMSKVYFEKGDIKSSLEYIQLAMNTSILSEELNNDPYTNPKLQKYYDLKDFFWYMKFKSEILENGFFQSKNIKGLAIAHESFLDSDSLITKLRRSYIQEKDQLSLGKMGHDLYASAAKGTYGLLQVLNKDNVSSLGLSLDQAKQKYKEALFQFMEKDKGAVLSASMAEINARKYGGVSKELIVKQEELQKEITSIEEQLLLEEKITLIEKKEEELFVKTQQKKSLIEKMESDFPKYKQLKNNTSLRNLSDIQSKLDTSSLMISYFLTDKDIYVLYITHDNLEIMKQDKYERFTKEIIGLRNSIVYDSKSLFTVTSSKLFSTLFPKPIPEGVENIVVIPDGHLVFIPFETLLTRKISSTTNYADMPYLIKDYAVSYAYSANIWYETQHNNHNNSKNKGEGFFAMAPVFNDQSKAHVVERGVKSLEVSTLPNTKTEVIALQRLFVEKGRMSKVLIEDEASEEAIKNRSLRDVGYLHLASHGFVNQDKPKLSGILLANTSTTQDNVLYSGEIQNLELNTYLTTLSACQTGMGKVSTGEGLIGLSRSLLYAGSQNLLVSLWNLNDPCAKDFMVSFYSCHLLKEQSLNSAARLAKLELMKTPKYSSPYYWSPYILVGQ